MSEVFPCSVRPGHQTAARGVGGQIETFGIFVNAINHSLRFAQTTGHEDIRIRIFGRLNRID